MSPARVQFFSVSPDGSGTGDVQRFDAPFGHAGEPLHECPPGWAPIERP